MTASSIDLALLIASWSIVALFARWIWKRAIQLVTFFKSPLKAPVSSQTNMAVKRDCKPTLALVEQSKVLNTAGNGIRFKEGPTSDAIKRAEKVFSEEEFSTSDSALLKWIKRHPQEQFTDLDYGVTEHIELK